MSGKVWTHHSLTHDPYRSTLLDKLTHFLDNMPAQTYTIIDKSTKAIKNIIIKSIFSEFHHCHHIAESHRVVLLRQYFNLLKRGYYPLGQVSAHSVAENYRLWFEAETFLINGKQQKLQTINLNKVPHFSDLVRDLLQERKRYLSIINSQVEIITLQDQLLARSTVAQQPVLLSAMFFPSLQPPSCPQPVMPSTYTQSL